MRNYLGEYIKYLEKELTKKNNNWNKLMDDLLIKIKFFQHERLIHLLVTLAFGIFTLIALALGILGCLFVFLMFLFIGFLIPYIYHYYFLETRVQYLYKIYDKLKEKI